MDLKLVMWVVKNKLLAEELVYMLHKTHNYPPFNEPCKPPKTRSRLSIIEIDMIMRKDGFIYSDWAPQCRDIKEILDGLETGDVDSD